MSGVKAGSPAESSVEDRERPTATPARDAGVPREVTHEIRVTLTVAIPYRGVYPRLVDAADAVIRALQQREPLPEGSYLRGGITVAMRTTKEIAADEKRAAAKRRREE